MDIISKIISTIESEGIISTIQKVPAYLYRNIIRPILPTVGYQTFNGIKVMRIKVGDKYLPANWRSFVESEKPNYETALVKGLKKFVKTGDKVVIVGGGNGITTSIASKLTGPTGMVNCYEASKQSYKKIKKTLLHNDLPNNIEIINKCVGEPVSIWGNLSESEIVKADELPVCDLLELDCEGAERKILRELSFKPKTILVETHGNFNSPTKKIRKLLNELGYQIINIEIADIDSKQHCIENDIRVIWAQKRN